MTIKTFVIVYAVLMLLLAATVAIHSLQLGVWNVVANMSIATIKAALIALFFMRLWDEGNMVRLFALIGIVWLAILFSLTLTDYLDRHQGDEFYPADDAERQDAERQHAAKLRNAFCIS